MWFRQTLPCDSCKFHISRGLKERKHVIVQVSKNRNFCAKIFGIYIFLTNSHYLFPLVIDNNINRTVFIDIPVDKFSATFGRTRVKLRDRHLQTEWAPLQAQLLGYLSSCTFLSHLLLAPNILKYFA